MMTTKRILLYAEGDFSYTEALCKQLSAEISVKKFNYEIIATDFCDRPENEIKVLIDRIQNVLKEMKTSIFINVSIITKVDATKHDPRITGQFDKIICNFPTPFGLERLDMTKMISQIKSSNLLKQNGELSISYWVDAYTGTYEYAYRLAKAQKKNGLSLIKREILDIEELKKLGYGHILHSGEKNIIEHLPFTATYVFNKNLKSDLKDDLEYDELSDSEELANDALPARWFNKYYGSAHASSSLNFKGIETTRWNNQLLLFNSSTNKFSIEDINNLIKSKQYREADRRLTVLLEADYKKIINFSCDQRAYYWIIKPINEAYDAAPIIKPSRENLLKYHQEEWYAKLKVLTGVKIPELVTEFRWQ